MQMVVTTPIARWQVWLGKWVGIMSLNAALLFISRGQRLRVVAECVAAKLSPEQQHVLQNEIFVARGSAKERSYDAEINAGDPGNSGRPDKKEPGCEGKPGQR